MSLFEVVTSFDHAQPGDLVLDLGDFTYGHSQLGHVPDPRDFFASSLAVDDFLKIESEGFETGTKDQLLDYFFITVAAFRGSYRYKGKPWILNGTTTPERVQQSMGTPYWIDRSDKEIILFYEFNRGTIEVQFEFPGQKHLGYIALMRNGVMSDLESRQAYRVTALWPPA